MMTQSESSGAPRLVVGVDASEGARRALRWALAEGRVRGRPVEALGVWSDFDQHDLTAQGFMPQFDEEAAAAALHGIVVGERAGFDDVELVEQVVCDLAARALLDAAAYAELLVVGARGLGGVKALLLGSVSDQCVRHSPCPVAVVRGERHQDGDIVVGIDDSDNARAALRWAVEEAARRQVTVRAVWSWQFPAVASGAWEAAALAVDDYETGAKEALDVVVDAVGEDFGGSLPATVEPIVVQGHSGLSLTEAAEQAAMLVIGARGHGGFTSLLLGSTSTFCVHHATGPVVIVPHHP